MTRPQQNKPRKRNQGAETERRLLEAATAAFAEKGYERVSLKDVAAKANVTAGSVYLYFKDKEALYQAASLHSVSRSTVRILARVEQGTSPREKLTFFIRALAETIIADAENTKLFERHLLGDETALLAQTIHAAFTEPFELLLKLMREVTGKHKTVTDCAAIFALILGLSQFSTLLSSDGRYDIGMHRDADRLADYVIATLLPEIA